MTAMLETRRVVDLPPMQVGTIFEKRGVPFIFRVIGPDNLVQRFVGTRSERRAVLKEWRKVAEAQKALAAVIEPPLTP